MTDTLRIRRVKITRALAYGKNNKDKSAGDDMKAESTNVFQIARRFELGGMLGERDEKKAKDKVLDDFGCQVQTVLF